MKLLKYNILILLFIALVGCSESDDLTTVTVKDKGFLRLENSLTKATTPTDNFIVTIRKQSNDNRVYSAIRAAYPDLYELEVGDYYIDAVFPSDENYKLAAFEQPRFYGKSNELRIEADKVTECEDVNCLIQNMKVTVAVDDLVRQQFEEYLITVSITDDQGKEHTLDFNSNTTTAGWFHPLPLKVKFKGTRREIDDEVEMEFNINTDIEKAYHHKIEIKGSYLTQQ